MTGTDLCVNKCKQSRSYLNHLVLILYWFCLYASAVCCLMMQGLSSGTCVQSKSSGSNNSSFKHMHEISQEQSSINRLLTLNFTYGGGGGGGGTFVFLVSCVYFLGMLVAISLLHRNSKLVFCR